MLPKGMDDRNPVGAKFLLQLLYPFHRFDDESQMIELLFRSGLEKIFRHLMERQVVAARREINVFGVGLPDDIHAEKLPVERCRASHIADLESDMTHSAKAGDACHAGTITQEGRCLRQTGRPSGVPAAQL